MFDEKSYKILLNMVHGVGPKVFMAIIKHFSSAENACRASKSELKAVLNEQLAERLYNFAGNPLQLEKELKLIEKNGINVFCQGEDGYPEAFARIASPPPVVYVKGNLDFFDKEFVISVVGTRKPTSYGKEAACDLVKKLVQSGFCTASGFAIGIDSFVHRAALEADSATAAVLGCGLLINYPYANMDIKEKICREGVIISEYPLCYPPLAENFPRRNRLIAALGIGTLVIEADEKSGSMITVCEALNQGKDVFSVPGSIYSPYSRGTNRLIMQGAKLVRDVQDITDELGVKANREFKFMEEKDIQVRLDNTEQRILNLIGWEPTNIDRLTEQSSMFCYELAKTLIELELKGFVRTLPGKQYVRTKQ